MRIPFWINNFSTFIFKYNFFYIMTAFCITFFLERRNISSIIRNIINYLRLANRVINMTLPEMSKKKFYFTLLCETYYYNA